MESSMSKTEKENEQNDNESESSSYDARSGNRHSMEHRGTVADPEEEQHYDFIINLDSDTEKHSFEHKELATDSISEILDCECGEPMLSQQVTINFNQWEGCDDNEFVQTKCIDFWKLVETNPLIQHLKVFPDENHENVDTTNLAEDIVPQKKIETPQLSAISIIEQKGRIVNDVFISKFRRHYCEEGSGDFFMDTPQAINAETTPKLLSVVETPEASTKSQQGEGGISKLGSIVKKRQVYHGQREDLAKLCKELEEWDMGHPKSMEPPGPEPILSHAVMQK